MTHPRCTRFDVSDGDVDGFVNGGFTAVAAVVTGLTSVNSFVRAAYRINPTTKLISFSYSNSNRRVSQRVRQIDADLTLPLAEHATSYN